MEVTFAEWKRLLTVYRNETSKSIPFRQSLPNGYTQERASEIQLGGCKFPASTKVCQLGLTLGPNTYILTEM